MEKTCIQHADAPAVASCKVCEKSLCLMCTTEVGGDIFCSPKCADVFSEVKDWIEPKARPEEWNPLADTGSTSAHQLPEDDTALEMPKMNRPVDNTTIRGRALPEDESMLDLGRIRPVAQPPPPEPEPEPDPFVPVSESVPADSLPKDESLLDLGRMAGTSGQTQVREPEKTCSQHPDLRAVGACTKCGGSFCGSCAVDTSWGTFCTVECSVGYQSAAKPQSTTSKLMPALLGVAAAALIVVGFLILGSGGGTSKEDPSIAKTEPVKPEPAKTEPVKPLPKPEPINPDPPKPPVVVPVVAKVDPPKPEPAKPEPAKPEPPKPVVVAKVDPPKPEPVKPPPPKPEPPKHRVLARDPWMNEKPGAWYRVRTASGERMSYTDVGLKEHGPWYVVLLTQTRAAEKTEPERQEYVEQGELSLVRVERMMRRGVTHDFEVLEPKGGKGPWKWVAASGRYSGASLPEDWVAQKIEPATFGDQSLRVKDRDFDCLIVESGKSKVWISPACPIGEVKREGDGMGREIVDFGADWSKRPPFPEAPKVEIAKPEPPKPPVVVPVVVPAVVAKVDPPKPEPLKPEPAKVEPAKTEPPKEDPQVRVKRSLDQAALHIREATPLFKEIAEGMEAGLEDRAKLQSLLDKVQEVRRKLGEARRLYSDVKAEAVDPSMIENRIRKLDSLLETTAGCVDQLKSKL